MIKRNRVNKAKYILVSVIFKFYCKSPRKNIFSDKFEASNFEKRYRYAKREACLKYQSIKKLSKIQSAKTLLSLIFFARVTLENKRKNTIT